MSVKYKRTENVYKGFGVVYKITNSINNKVYIGQSIDFAKRISRYKNNSCHNQIKIHRAISKYLWSSFTVEILFKCKIDNVNRTCIALDAIEKFCIKKYNSISNGYNIKSGGANGKPSYETIEKMRLAKLNISDETRINYSNGQKLRFSKMTELERSNVSCKKPIAQYSMNGEFIRDWDSAADAGKYFGINYRCIAKVCRGTYKSSQGYLWRFKKI